jgi:NitT/TauT family transport system permease protein
VGEALPAAAEVRVHPEGAGEHGGALRRHEVAVASAPQLVEAEGTRSRGRLRAPVGSRRFAVRLALTLASAAALFLAWWLLSRRFEDYILPAPISVWRSFASAVERGVWTREVGATLEHLGAGFGLVIVTGLPLGILLGRFWPAEDLGRVPLILLQTLPTLVLILLMQIFVGANESGVIAVTAASGFTYFTLNVIQGTKQIDHDLVEMGRAYGAREAALLRSVYLPSVVPYFLAAARITLGVCWQVTLFAEYLLGTPGVGFQVSTEIKLLDTASVFSWGLSVVALTLAVEYGVFRPVERFLLRSQRRER